MAYTVTETTSGPALPDLPFRATGDQPAFEPGALERFLAAVRVAVLAYTRADGRPNQTPMWYVYRDGVVYMSTMSGSAKHRALERNPRVCITIQDEEAPYRAVIVDGTVSLSPRDPDNDPTAGLAVRYLGRLGAAQYDKLTAEAFATSGQMLITLRPDAVRGFDNTRVIGRATRAFIKVRSRLPILRRWL